MNQKWHYIIYNKKEKQFISNYIDSELAASSICFNFETMGYDVVVLEKAKSLPYFNFYNPLNYFFKNQEVEYV